MLKTWSFWKAFFGVFVALVGGIQIFADPYISFEGEALKQFLGPSWWIIYYFVPLIIALSIAALTNAREETQAESLDQRNRRVMLDHVENFWVKGVLEKSLHAEALRELGIKEDAATLSYPWTIKREATNETLPAGKSMLEIFQEIGMGRSLLILGAPGSGKSTMLLELARQLIARARANETERIPIVFNLGSWNEQQTISDWLAEQLHIVYYVPEKTAPTWISENKLLLLLDGLDEVKPDSRAKCVEAIKLFRNEHGLTSLAVCSRLEDYKAINEKLLLQEAIILQPLSMDQINAYIDKFGNTLASLRLMLKRDSDWQELAKSPLTLSIMALAYKDIPPEGLLDTQNFEDQRKHLFDTYIARMFKRPTRTVKSSFTDSQTLHYLNWLARMMKSHNIITYQIETTQPSWLENKSQARLYRLYTRLTLGLIVGLISGLGLGLTSDWIWGVSGGLIFGLMGSLATEQTGEFTENSIRKIDKLTWESMIAQGKARGWLIFGRPFGVMYRNEPRDWSTDRITMVDKLTWSWKASRSRLASGLIGGLFFGLLAGLIGFISIRNSGSGRLFIEMIFVLGLGLMLARFFGLSVGLLSVLLSWLFGGGSVGLIFSLLFGLVFGLSGGLILGLLGGMTSEQIDEATYPTQRLKRTLFNGLFSTLVVGLSIGLSVGLIFRAWDVLIVGLIGGLGIGLIGGLRRGYLSLIQHYALRLVLERNQLLPRQLIGFMDYAVDLIFLRRVGGSYIFIHRLIMEHFAEMDV